MENIEIHRIDWFGCYDATWQQAPLLAEAYSHPAKVPFGLADRIYRHMLSNGWLQPGDRVADPFGGVGGLGFHAALYGLHWTGCELEARFVELGGTEYDCPGFRPDFWRRYAKRPAYIAKLRAEHKLCPSCESALAPKTVLQKRTKHDSRPRFVLQRAIPARAPHAYRGNIPLWRERYAPVIADYGSARLLQGDSRRLRAVIAEADARVSSPPYAESDPSASHVQGHSRLDPSSPNYRPFAVRSIKDGYNEAREYGTSDGQLGAMPAGDFDATIASPPYAQARIDGHGDEGASGLRAEDGGYLRGPDGWQQRKAMGGRYGDSAGNLANLPAGELVDSVVSSPPYAETINQTDGANDAQARVQRKAAAGVDVTQPVNIGGPNSVLNQPQNYGSAPGNLSALRAGDWDATISSPPYADGAQHTGGETRMTSGQGGPIQFVAYGSSPGQLADLPAGDFDASVASPPYEQRTVHGQAGVTREGFADPARVGKTSAALVLDDYGADPDNLGNNTGETFWSAARTILEETFAILKPGGYAAWITGDFVRDKKRVLFGEQWLALCEAVGFEPVLWAVAWKAETHGTQLDMFGNPVELKTSKVSFFRRLANRNNPGAAIENEDVIFVRKPL